MWPFSPDTAAIATWLGKFGTESVLLAYTNTVSISLHFPQVDTNTLLAPAMFFVMGLYKHDMVTIRDDDTIQTPGKGLFVNVRVIQCAVPQHFSLVVDDSPTISIMLPSRVGMAQCRPELPGLALFDELDLDHLDLIGVANRCQKKAEQAKGTKY